MIKIYLCDSCKQYSEFEDKAFKDRVRCPYCKKNKLILKRVSTGKLSEESKTNQTTHIHIYQEPKTLGHLAKKNAEKMGKYERQETDPTYHKRKELKKDAPWWRQGTTEIDPKLSNMNRDQMRRYVRTGQK